MAEPPGGSPLWGEQIFAMVRRGLRRIPNPIFTPLFFVGAAELVAAESGRPLVQCLPAVRPAPQDPFVLLGTVLVADSAKTGFRGVENFCDVLVVEPVYNG